MPRITISLHVIITQYGSYFRERAEDRYPPMTDGPSGEFGEPDDANHTSVGWFFRSQASTAFRNASAFATSSFESLSLTTLAEP